MFFGKTIAQIKPFFKLLSVFDYQRQKIFSQKNRRINLTYYLLIFILFGYTNSAFSQNNEFKNEQSTPSHQGAYSKEESIQKLGPQIRALFDKLLQLYFKEGLFTNRLLALEHLGVKNVTREWLGRWNGMSDKERTSFKDHFASEGFFARPGWTGHFYYGGWRDKGDKWYANIDIFVDKKIECVDSRAVEGYLNLPFQTNPHKQIAALSFRPPVRQQGSSGSPYALALSPLLPNLGVGFYNGCMESIAVYNAFLYQNVSDENI